MKYHALLAAVTLASALFTLPAAAMKFDLGNAGGYGIVSIGAGGLTINSGPIVGGILAGGGAPVATSGGGNGQIIGKIDLDSTVSSSAFNGLQVKPGAAQFQSVSAQYVADALASAQAVSAYAASLAPNQTFGGTLSGATTFTGNGGVYVIDAVNISNAPLTFSGGANDFFVVNISGKYSTNVALTLNGVSASQLLFNFLGTSGNVFQTSGGDLSFGTYLATNGGDFQFSNLDLTGALINTAGHIQFVSGSTMTAAPIPEPQSVALLLAGLGLLGAFARRRLH